jgi:hypothetical protein
MNRSYGQLESLWTKLFLFFGLPVYAMSSTWSYLRNTEVSQLIIINLNDEDEDDEIFFEEIEK